MAGTDDSTEPQYARDVFVRLHQSLDVLVTDDAAIARMDEYNAPNYELRDDGAWLRPNAESDVHNWTPACDLDEGPTSPGPLTTPALPFPFTARHLAAFMLDGWGWHWAQRLAGEDGQPDLDRVQAFLGSVRDAKPRKAIVEAFAALEQARQQVGVPDMSFAQAEQAAAAALDNAMKEANRLHNWRERGIGEDERRARVEGRREMAAAAKDTLKDARETLEKDDEARRKAMVRWLLAPERGKLSRDEWSSLSNTDGPGSARPLPRARAQENAILAKFKEFGVDPLRLPKPKPGKSSPPVAKVRAALGSAYTPDVMQKAMTRLFKDGRAAYGDTSAD